MAASFTRYKLSATQRVDAVQVAEPLENIAILVGGERSQQATGSLNAEIATVLVPTLMGVIPAGIGDWIVKDRNNNQLTVMKNQNFVELYELA